MKAEETMKQSKRTTTERRDGAIERISAYEYDTSKAKRKGIPEDVWEKDRVASLKHLLSIRS